MRIEGPDLHLQLSSGLFNSLFFNFKPMLFCKYAFDCSQVTQIIKDLTITESRWLDDSKMKLKNGRWKVDPMPTRSAAKHYLRSGLSFEGENVNWVRHDWL